MSGSTVWRSKSGLVGGVAFGSFIGLVGLTQIDRPASKGGGIGVTIGALVIAGCLIAVAVRAAVVTSDRGVRIRNPLRTVEIPWSDVARFRIGRHKLLSEVCVVDLVGGSSQYAFGIQVPRAGRGVKEQRMIDSLNEIAAAHRETGFRGG